MLSKGNAVMRAGLGYAYEAAVIRAALGLGAALAPAAAGQSPFERPGAASPPST